MSRFALSALFLLSGLFNTSNAQEPDLSEFRTVDTAITTRISNASPTPKQPKLPGYLGAHVILKQNGQLTIADLATGSPALKAGLRIGDVIMKIDDKSAATVDGFRELIQQKKAGDDLKLAIVRDKESLATTVKLTALSRPMTRSSTTRQRAILGVQLGVSRTGVLLSRATPGSGAANGGLQGGDVLLEIDGKNLESSNTLRLILARKKPGDQIKVVYKRKAKEQTTTVKLGAAGDPRRASRGWDSRRRRGGWTKPQYRLAVIPIEFSDVKPNEKITTKVWDQALFSTSKYINENVTGQKVFGSLNDYYQEISYKKLRVTGKVFDYVKVAKKRDEYASSGVRRSTLFIEALDKLLARDKDALKDFDGIFFLYAGSRARSQRGGLYWPHRASFSYKGKRWSYFICPEGGKRMDSISVIAHEFGHMLGLPDLYSKDSTSEGLGVWCTMATGHGRAGRPLHFSAWSKEQLGWLKPAVIDPRTKQKLILSPIQESGKQCFKVLLRPDGSEYLLLENRVKKGFDRDLPGEGLLIWRVINNRPVLQESHGVTDTSGPRRYLNAVPFPSNANSAFTPYTTPSSRRNPSDLPVHITNIRRLPDGRITFYIGYEFF